jgi:predicted transcriptional regulator
VTIATCKNPMCTCTSCSCGDCQCGTATVGDLEGRVMDVLWDNSVHEPTVRNIALSFPDLAYTTVATMLDRLVEKGLAQCKMEKHTKRYSAVGSRAAYTAMAMYGSLRRTAEPGVALKRFLEVLSLEDRKMLQEAFRNLKRRPTRRT